MSYLGRTIDFDGYYGLAKVKIKAYNFNTQTYTVLELSTNKELMIREDDLEFIVKNHKNTLDFFPCVCGAETTKQPGHSDWCNKFNEYQ